MIRIRATSWRPSTFEELGRGGEAVVYRLREDTAAKVFLLPNACEFVDKPMLQEAARVRLAEMQTKLFEFPQDLPAGLVAPNAVLVNANEKVFGYAMPYIKGTSLDRMSRTSSVLSPKSIGALLARLHDLVCALHAKGVVIGDFSENNIIVTRGVPHLVDADSMQFGPYQCRSFIPRFTAPELLRMEKARSAETGPKRPRERDKNGRWRKSTKATSAPCYVLAAPHSEATDWYSFLVIAMRLITRTDPYGGVVPRMTLEERLRERVTVFDMRCVYPRVAKPLRSVPRPILELFFRVFYQGERPCPDREAFAAFGS